MVADNGTRDRLGGGSGDSKIRFLGLPERSFTDLRYALHEATPPAGKGK